jgi:Protein of unknown function DUF262
VTDYADLRDWRELEETEDDEELQVDEYDIAASSNDFNTLTMVNFIDAGSLRIPGFQRNYVWDRGRASKLIESLILGLPVPQVFLYEEARNRFLVIDGQQRLLSLYFFAKRRFPRRAKRVELRKVINESGIVPAELLHDDDYFENFNLRLPDFAPGKKNKFHRLNYSTLGEYRTQFDLRPIRNIILKQLQPSEDDSSIYEVFQRLNTGGVNLTPQEIRASMYYSPLFEMLTRVNLRPSWRKLLGVPDPDNHLRDVEILLRALAMSHSGDTFASSMKQFLNRFAKMGRSISMDDVAAMELDLNWFIDTVGEPGDANQLFQGRTRKFSVTLFEAAFSAAVELRRSSADYELDLEAVRRLPFDEQLLEYSLAHSNSTGNVRGRLRRARELLKN